MQENIGSNKSIKFEEENEGSGVFSEANNDELDLCEKCKRRLQDQDFYILICVKQSRARFKVKDHLNMSNLMPKQLLCHIT